MDQRALSTPPSEESSIETLANWLRAPARSERDKARAAFRWVTSRLRYDVDAYRNVCNGRPDNVPNQDVTMVLARRTAVCAGYARVYEALARAMGLEVEVVRGHCRTSSRAPWQAYGPQDAHAWNAVRIDGQWYLVDGTWGSGHMDAATGRFVSEFQPFYFLTPPDQLVSSHLPLDARWQLLASPLSEAQQKAKPLVSSAGFRHGLQLPPGVGARVQAGERAQFRFTARSGSLLSATLHAAAATRVARLEGAIFVERDGNTWDVQVACPARGPFVLEIYVGSAGGAAGANRTLAWATAFFVECTGPTTAPTAFPRQYGSYSEMGARLVGPRLDPLPARRSQRFEMIAPGALDMVLFNGSQQVHMTRDGDRFQCDAEPLAGQVVLGARYSTADQRFMSLVQYQAR